MQYTNVIIELYTQNLYNVINITITPINIIEIQKLFLHPLQIPGVTVPSTLPPLTFSKLTPLWPFFASSQKSKPSFLQEMMLCQIYPIVMVVYGRTRWERLKNILVRKSSIFIVSIFPTACHPKCINTLVCFERFFIFEVGMCLPRGLITQADCFWSKWKKFLNRSEHQPWRTKILCVVPRWSSSHSWFLKPFHLWKCWAVRGGCPFS